MQASNRRLERGARLGGEPPADQHLDRRLIEVLEDLDEVGACQRPGPRERFARQRGKAVELQAH